MGLKQSKFSLMLFGIILLGVLVLIGLSALYRKQQVSTNKLQAEYRTKSELFAKRNEELENQEAAEKKLLAIKAQLKVLDQNLADYKYIPTYLQQMQLTAKQTGNIIKSIQPGDLHQLNWANSPFASAVPVANAENPAAAATTPAPAAGTTAPVAQASTFGSQYQVVGINLDVQGNYVSIIRLLNAFRQFPKMIYVKSVDFSPQASESGVRISARFTTYAIITPDQYEMQREHSESAGGSKE